MSPDYLTITLRNKSVVVVYEYSYASVNVNGSGSLRYNGAIRAGLKPTLHGCISVTDCTKINEQNKLNR